MQKYFFILFIIIFVGCKSKKEELATKDFINSVFLIEEAGDYSWHPELNGGLSEENPYFYFMHENELALSYIRWNLIDEKLPDSIRYPSKISDEVQNDFQNFVNQDEEIKKAIQLLIYPEKFKNKYQIRIDSLVNLSSKLFFASSTDEGNVGWKLCAGKSRFPEVYGESKSYESVILQALCFQAVFKENYSNPKKAVWNFFNQKIPEVSTEMKSIEYDDYIKKANQLMWEKMSESQELKSLLVDFTNHESSKLYFNIKSN